MRSVTSVRGEDKSSGVRVRPWVVGRGFAHGDAGVGHGVQGVGELPGPVPNQDLELQSAAADVNDQIAELLVVHGPFGVGGDTETCT
jgi:hypothetical protein